MGKNWKETKDQKHFLNYSSQNSNSFLKEVSKITFVIISIAIKMLPVNKHGIQFLFISTFIYPWYVCIYMQ